MAGMPVHAESHAPNPGVPGDRTGRDGVRGISQCPGPAATAVLSSAEYRNV